MLQEWGGLRPPDLVHAIMWFYELEDPFTSEAVLGEQILIFCARVLCLVNNATTFVHKCCVW